jgi:hypothetical protein
LLQTKLERSTENEGNNSEEVVVKREIVKIIPTRTRDGIIGVNVTGEGGRVLKKK